MEDHRAALLLYDLAYLNVVYALVSPINDVRLICHPIFEEDWIVHKSELVYGVKTQAVLWSQKTSSDRNSARHPRHMFARSITFARTQPRIYG